MTPPEPKACTACAYHVQDGIRHLCLVVAAARDADGAAIIATTEGDKPFFGGVLSFSYDELSCDRARRMGQACGPAGQLWEPRQA